MILKTCLRIPSSVASGMSTASSRLGCFSLGHSARHARGLRIAHGTPSESPSESNRPLRRSGKNIAARSIFIGTFSLLTYMGFAIYADRNPPNQLQPDPDKKTVVILGTGWGSVSLLRKLNTDNYNVIVVSPRNYFLFTPLLPSCTTGTVEHRSIMEPIRNFLRHKTTAVKFYEAECTNVDYEKRLVHISDRSEVKGAISGTEMPFDYLVVAVGAESATFGIPGVHKYGLFLKEVEDAQRIRKRIMDCVETAAFKDQSVEDMKRLLHIVVVGGGPTGVEFAAELQDFFQSDLRKWIPEIREHFRVTLIEALPSVLPMFSKTLVKYTEQTFKEGSIDIRTKTTVKDVGATHIRAESYDLDNSKITEEIPYGLLVWATGNSVRPVVQSLMNQIPEQAHSRRGLTVDEHLAVRGANNVWALGDCAVANCAPTAQVAAQQGTFLAALLDQRFEVEEMEEKLKALGAEHCATSGPERYSIGAEMRDLHRKLRRKKQIAPFEYTHQGSLAYIGSEKAVADITWFTGDSVALGGLLTYFFWRSAYLNMCFSTRNRLLVAGDWIKSYVFGRDVCRE